MVAEEEVPAREGLPAAPCPPAPSPGPRARRPRPHGRPIARPPPSGLPLTVRRLLKVHVRVAQGAAGDHIPADPDGEDGPGRAELLVEHRLRHVGVQVPHVQGGHGIAGGAGVHLGTGCPRGRRPRPFP